MSPVRTCAVCRLRQSDAVMNRAGRAPDGVWYLGRGSGRGLWWCANTTCQTRLQLSHAQKALRQGLSGPEVEMWKSFVQRLQPGQVVKE